MQSIGLLDWTICFGYLAFVIGLGIYFSNKQKDNDDFFLGGRNMHWLPVGLSLFATTFSSNSFVGLPAECRGQQSLKAAGTAQRTGSRASPTCTP